MNKIAAILFSWIVLMNISGAYAQYTTIDEARDYINDRLSHSVLQKVDPDGLVTISAPGSKIKFKLQEVSFNYNGANDDDRLRVFCDNCIEHYENKQLKEKTSRQSFVCESEQEVNEAIAAFRFLKKKFGDNLKGIGQTDQPIKGADPSLGYSTVSETIDFINANLSHSVIMGFDANGILTINAPDDIYSVNMKMAEFSNNRSSDESKVRIYGDFCVTENKGQRKEKVISRQSFKTTSAGKTYEVIKALYYLKSSCSDLDPAKISGLKNVGKNKTNSYINVAEAIDFINDRLSYSIIMGIDQSGNLSVNAPDDIYRFNIHKVEMHKTDRRYERYDWFPFAIPGGYTPGVLFECDDCIKQYSSPASFETMDEQVFQCGNMTDVKEVLKALAYIKGFSKK